MQSNMSNGNNIRCQFIDQAGHLLEGSEEICLPQDAGPKELQQIIHSFLNEERLPYTFFISNKELRVELGTYLQQNKVSMEKILQIIYQPQALFRICPITRCSAVIAGHEEAVLCVAFSPDGQQLATGSGDSTVRLWDLQTQTPMYRCTGHKNWILCIAWSPDGEHLVSGSKAGELQAWDPRTGNPSGKPFIGHRKWITGICWEPMHIKFPCRRFVSSSKDGDARVWDIYLRRCVLCLSGHTLAVTCVKWGGNGRIYTGSQDCTIKVWETQHGGLIRVLKGHGHWVNSLALSTEYILRTGAFDPLSKPLSSSAKMKIAMDKYEKMTDRFSERLVSGSDDFSMLLWELSDCEDPECKHCYCHGPKARMTGHQQTVAALGGNSYIRKVLQLSEPHFDPTTTAVCNTIAASDRFCGIMTETIKLVNHVCFSPDGQWVASASFDKSVKLWNGLTGEYVAVFRGHVGPVYQICWSADGRYLLSASKDSTLKLWDIQTHKLKRDLPGHLDEVYAVDWSPNGEKAASGGKDRALKLWMG